MRFTVKVPHHVKAKVKQTNWKKIGIIAGASLVGLLLIIQLLYPWNNLPPNAKIDGVKVGGKSKSDAAVQLDSEYANHTVAIYMGTAKKPVVSPKFSDMDVRVDNTARMKDAGYPWYLRIVPTSLFWAGAG